MLRERLRPVGPAGTGNAVPRDARDPLWLRYADLVKLGFSPETSMIAAAAPVPLKTVTALLAPDGHRP